MSRHRPSDLAELVVCFGQNLAGFKRLLVHLPILSSEVDTQAQLDLPRIVRLRVNHSKRLRTL